MRTNFYICWGNRDKYFDWRLKTVKFNTKQRNTDTGVRPHNILCKLQNPVIGWCFSLGFHFLVEQEISNLISLLFWKEDTIKYILNVSNIWYVWMFVSMKQIQMWINYNFRSLGQNIAISNWKLNLAQAARPSDQAAASVRRSVYLQMWNVDILQSLLRGGKAWALYCANTDQF